MLLLAGCQSIANHRQSPGPDLSGSAGHVRVREGFLEGQRMKIPMQGLTLDTVLENASRSGGFQGQGSRTLQDYFVVLARGRTRMFVPMLLVQGHMAGSIQMQHGDRIELVDANKTELYSKLLDPTNSQSDDIPAGMSFQWVGLVSRPGQKKTFKAGQDLGENAAADGEKVYGNVTGDVLVLSRTNGATVDQYVIPDLKNFGQTWTIKNRVIIRDGDRILATNLAIVPIIRDGVRRSQRGRELARQAADAAANPDGVVQQFRNHLDDSLPSLPSIPSLPSLPPISIPRLPRLF